MYQYYVYELVDSNGVVAYVGKGSTGRLKAQIKNYGLSGYEVARFKKEAAAYDFEKVRIAEVAPYLNKHPGGNGSKCILSNDAKNYFKEIKNIGTRAYAARLLLAFGGYDLSKVDLLRKVAYG